MKNFFRFPHTPHLVWLGEGSPRSDKILSVSEASALLRGNVVVEEKLDGANLGFSLTPDGFLQIQNRGGYLTTPYVGQFSRLSAWLAQHSESLYSVLKPELIIFGEWCAARHSLEYQYLPDWFILFDVYDQKEGRFWSTSRRNALAVSIGIMVVPKIMFGKFSINELKKLTNSMDSQFRDGPLEGVVIRSESSEWCDSRAKLVRPGFIQDIEKHWRKRRIEWNSLLLSEFK